MKTKGVDSTLSIPTYNRLPLLQQAVASVLAQRIGPWEFLLVDDGSEEESTDETNHTASGITEKALAPTMHHREPGRIFDGADTRTRLDHLPNRVGIFAR